MGSREQVLLVTVVVVAVMMVASVGFASISDNPLVPDNTLEVRDDSDDYDVTRQGTVGMVRIRHAGGDAVEINNTELVLSSNTTELQFTSEANWTAHSGNLTFELQLEHAPVTDSAIFAPQEELRVVKSSGTGDFTGSFSVRVRLLHTLSRTVLIDEQVTVR